MLVKKKGLVSQEVEEGGDVDEVSESLSPSRVSARTSTISERKAVRVALSIPEAFVPTPHKQFMKDIKGSQSQGQEEEEEEVVAGGGSPKKSMSMLMPSSSSSSCSPSGSDVEGSSPPDQEGDEEYKVSIISKGANSSSTGRVTRDRGLRSTFARYKKWDEAERCVIELLEGNKIRVDGETVVEEVDHTNYVKESDVILEYGEDWRDCEMPAMPDIPLVATTSLENGVEEGGLCGESHCRLGCVCESIKNEVVRDHCGKAKCFFECNCTTSKDDGDIRSRLRPRVSLLNWRFLNETESDKDAPPANYKQLGHGINVYPRAMRRAPVAPQRFKNGYLQNMSAKMKECFNRKRTKSPGHDLKLIRKATATVTASKRTYLDKMGTSSKPPLLSSASSSPSGSGILKENSRPLVLKKLKIPRRPPILTAEGGEPKRPTVLTSKKKGKIEKPEEPKQEPLEIPTVIKAIERDAVLVMIGSDGLLNVSYSITLKHPRIVLYDLEEGDVDIPWMYLPFPSSGEGWLLHRLDSLEETTFTFIPELNIMVPSKVLKMHQNQAINQLKTVSAKIFWIGRDCKQQNGSFYFFPQAPDIIVIGPLPKDQMQSKFHPEFDRLTRTLNAGLYLDYLSMRNSDIYSSGPSVPPTSTWDTFFHTKKVQKSRQLKANLKLAAETEIASASNSPNPNDDMKTEEDANVEEDNNNPEEGDDNVLPAKLAEPECIIDEVVGSYNVDDLTDRADG